MWTWNYIVGHVLLLAIVNSGIYISGIGQFEKHCNKNLHHGKLCLSYVNENIVAMTMIIAVLSKLPQRVTTSLS